MGKNCHFSSPKKRTKNVCPSRLGQKFEFSSSFFGRIEDTRKAFRNQLTFSRTQLAMWNYFFSIWGETRLLNYVHLKMGTKWIEILSEGVFLFLYITTWFLNQIEETSHENTAKICRFMRIFQPIIGNMGDFFFKCRIWISPYMYLSWMLLCRFSRPLSFFLFHIYVCV